MLGRCKLASTGTTCATTNLCCGPTGWLDCKFLAGLLRKAGGCSMVLTEHLPLRPLAETMCATLWSESFAALPLAAGFTALKYGRPNRKVQI